MIKKTEVMFPQNKRSTGCGCRELENTTNFSPLFLCNYLNFIELKNKTCSIS